MMTTNNSRFSLLAVLFAVLIVAAGVAVGWRLVRGDGSLLRNVTVQHESITPNADGDTDATLISYEISRNATVSIYFEDESGRRHAGMVGHGRGAV